MRIHSFSISGYRRLAETTIRFGDATFLIGANNSGKSSVVNGLEALLSGKTRLPDSSYFSKRTSGGETERVADEITLEAEFRGLPEDAKEWRGFRGRVHAYIDEDDPALRKNQSPFPANSLLLRAPLFSIAPLPEASISVIPGGGLVLRSRSPVSTPKFPIPNAPPLPRRLAFA